MELLDNSKNTSSKVEPKEGERELLSSNTAGIRSPSLEFDSNTHEEDVKQQLDYLAEILFEFFSEKKKNDRKHF